MKPIHALAPIGAVAFAAALGGCVAPIPMTAGPVAMPQYCLGNNAAITAALAGTGTGLLGGLLSHNALVGLGSGLAGAAVTYAVLESNCQQVATHNALAEARAEAEAAEIARQERLQEEAAATARAEEREAERMREERRLADARAKEKAAEAKLVQTRGAKAKAEQNVEVAKAQPQGWVDPQTKAQEKIVPLNNYTNKAGQQCLTYHKVTYVNGTPQITGPSTTSCQGGASG